MLFSSITFLYFFLPVALLCYAVTPKGYKNLCLCILSCLFYAWGEPSGVFLMLGQIGIAYILTVLTEKKKGTNQGRILYVLSCLVPFAVLFYYKYSYFFLHGLIPALPKATLPIGISFYTFQLVSYIVDVHRGRVKLQNNPVDLAAFVTLFPQLIAGPIVRYIDVERELTDRKVTISDFSDGCVRFTVGLAKKVLFANLLGEFVQEASEMAASRVLLAWVYAAAVAMQIYYDFSGYSDMAIGLGRMFGFHFPENFRYPFLSRSATEFWRRWHITLGAWFRDYVYIPLGGNRVKPVRWMLHIMLVWLLTGLWHGAGWNFILWGGLFGVLLLLEKGIRVLYERYVPSELKYMDMVKAVLCHGYMLVVILVSFLIFHTEDMNRLGQNLAALIGCTSKFPLYNVTQVSYLLQNRMILLILSVIGTTPFPHRLWERYRQHTHDTWIYGVTQTAGILILLVLCTAYLIDGSFNPFLYFRF